MPTHFAAVKAVGVNSRAKRQRPIEFLVKKRPRLLFRAKRNPLKYAKGDQRMRVKVTIAQSLAFWRLKSDPSSWPQGLVNRHQFVGIDPWSLRLQKLRFLF